MYLAFSAWAMPKRPVEEQVEIVRGCGYAGIELVSRPGTAIDAEQLDDAARQRLRHVLEASGLAVPSIAAHGNLLAADPARRAAELAQVRAGIDLAAGLADLGGHRGPPCVVCMGHGKPDEYESLRERIADNFRELAAYAAPRGVTVALEPHVGQAIDQPEKVQWLIDRVGSPHFRLNFDNSHFEVMGRDLDEYVAPLAPLSVHTHLKDQRGVSPDYQFLVPGEGDFDYPRYLRAMQAAGYTGAITVEISVAVQRRPDYDPLEVARRSFATLTQAADAAGVTLRTSLAAA